MFFQNSWVLDFDVIKEQYSKCGVYNPGPIFSEMYQHQITEEDRAILLDWLQEICQFHGFCRTTYHCAVILSDLMLARTEVVREEYQLIGCTALFIAAKQEEVPVFRA